MKEPVGAIEITEFRVREGDADAFDGAIRGALPILDRQSGMLARTFGQSREDPSIFFLIVEWRDVRDHVERFRGSDDFDRFVTSFRHFLREPARVSHITR